MFIGGLSTISLIGFSKMRIRKITYVLALFLILSTSCVYYNTFWYAKEYYKRAERARKKAEQKARLLPSTVTGKRESTPETSSSQKPSTSVSGDAKALYEKSIEKSSKVLAIYPESDYVDDALFLIGLCYFRMGEYDKAIRKFDELYTNFPESPFIPQARFYRGWANMMLGNYGTSAFEFQVVLDDKILGEDALFMLAELAYIQNDYPKARDGYKKFIEKYPNSKRLDEAYLKLADVYFHTDSFEQCEKTAEKIKGSSSPNIRFDANLLLARAKLELQKFDEALDILNNLLTNTDDKNLKAEVELLIGEVYYRWGKLEDAEKVWIGVTVKYPKTPASSMAYLRLGELYQKKNWDLVKAGEMYNKAVNESPNSPSARIALMRSQSILELEKVKAFESDTTNKEQLLNNYFKMAEIYLFDLDVPDSALSIYKHIWENYRGSPSSCRALYGIAWINQYSYKDITSSDSLYSMVLDSCKGTDWAPKAAEYFKMRGTALDSTKVQTVAYFFVKAEEFRLTYGWMDSAMKYYSKVVEEYPNSAFEPKALLSMALILKSQGEKDSADVIYNLVSKKYADTDYAKEAQFQLGLLDSPPERLAKVVLAPKETSAETTITREEKKEIEIPKDTTSFTSLPLAPTPKERGELIYPEQEYSSALEGKILKLRILINSFGEVVDAQLLGSSGNPVIDQAAILAAKRTKFDPLTIDITKYNTWFLYEIRITKPVREY